MDWAATLLTAPANLAIVNLLKGLGLPSKFAPLASVVIGAVFGLAVTFLQTGGFESAAAFVMTGILTGLTASGLYDVTATIASKPTGETD